MMSYSDVNALLGGNNYPGRGIIIGMSADGSKAMTAYFIMGRSVNSRNRVFESTEDGIRTKAYDPSKMADPSLIIYHPVRRMDKDIIVTNGDQTDTIREYIAAGKTFEAALDTRCFEPDAPNWTPRISGLMHFDNRKICYKLNILKAADAAGTDCDRFTYSYTALAGRGHLIHTYEQDGNPLPSFFGEPRAVSIPNDVAAFADGVWNALDNDNKISLYVCGVDIATGEAQTVILNKNI